jgi:hypothetical protein
MSRIMPTDGNDVQIQMSSTDQSGSNETWQTLHLNETKSWIYPKQSLENVFDFIKKDYPLKKKRFHHYLNFEKLILRSLMFIYIVIIFITDYIKCFKVMWGNQIESDEFLSDFYKITSNKQVLGMRIQFCSCLYEDKHYFYFLNSTFLGYILFYLKIIYFLSEGAFIFLPTLHYFYKKKYRKIWCCISILIAPIVLLIYYMPFIIIAYIFEGLNYLMDSDQKFSFSRPFDLFNAISLFDSLYIQLTALFTMYTIKDNFKVVGLPGVLLIKHSKSLKNLLGLSILGTLLSKVFSPLFNTLKNSDLSVRVFNCSTSNETYIDCNLNDTLTVKVSDLSDEMRKEFYYELNSYALDNSLLNQIFPFFTFAYCLFFIFIFIHCIYEKCGCYKSDLELARIEQHLIKYYSNDDVSLASLAKKFISNLKNKKNNPSESTTRETPRNYKLEIVYPILNWITWRPFYFFYQMIFEKNKVDIALEKIKLFLELNQLGIKPIKEQ